MKKVLINEKWELNLPNHRHNPEWWKTWEKPRLAAMFEVINKDSIVFDIGAEEGDFSALFASWGAGVVPFEPNPDIWPNIRACFEYNNLEPLDSFAGFVNEKTWAPLETGDRFVNVNSVWPTCSEGKITTTNNFRSIHERSHDTPSISIDDFVKRSGIVPTILNIDVEGAEYLVIKGALETLKDNNIHIFVSIHPEMLFHIYQKYTLDIISVLGPLGYGWKILAFDHEFHFYFSKP